MYLSTADGSRAITDALTESYRIVKAAHALRGEPFTEAKGGATFHFSLPGSVQGFEADGNSADVAIENPTGGSLHIRPRGSGIARVMTPTFIPEEALAMPGYQLFASPTLYSGQTITAVVRNESEDTVNVRLALRHYGAGNRSELVSGELVALAAGAERTLTWTVPDTGGLPIHAAGLEIEGAGPVALDSMTWDGTPTVTFHRPADRSATLWQRAWVDAVDHFEGRYFEAFRISQNQGRGVMAQGGGDWIDYTVRSAITPYLARNAGLAVRVQGLRRYYALLLGSDGVARLVKMDDSETILAETPFAWDLFTSYTLSLTVEGATLTGVINNTVKLTATDPGSRLAAGAAGFVIEEGTLGAESLTVSAAR
jgi:hypothetical protein